MAFENRRKTWQKTEGGGVKVARARSGDRHGDRHETPRFCQSKTGKPMDTWFSTCWHALPSCCSCSNTCVEEAGPCRGMAPREKRAKKKSFLLIPPISLSHVAIVFFVPRQLALYIPGVLNTVSVAVPVPIASPSTDHLVPIHVVDVESDMKSVQAPEDRNANKQLLRQYCNYYDRFECNNPKDEQEHNNRKKRPVKREMRCTTGVESNT